ncbi:MAG: DNA methyltransferase [Myxococcaceae bacterium]
MLPTCVHGDARDGRAYEEALHGARADLLHADPPYCLLTRRRRGGDLRDLRAHKKIDRDPVVRFEAVRDYRKFTEEWLGAAVQHLSVSAVMVLWTNFLGKEPIVATSRSLGFSHLWGEFVWAKRTKDREGNEQLLRVYEVALVLARTPAPPEAPNEKPIPWSVVAGYDDEGHAEDFGSHPHHKPFGVLDPLIRQYSALGQTVLDPFAGSGSIPAAALRLGRVPACIESQADWAKRVTERLRTPER